MKRKLTSIGAFCLLMAGRVAVTVDQQVIFQPSAMPRVDIHTHMDAKPQYLQAVEAMNQWGGTGSISLAGCSG